MPQTQYKYWAFISYSHADSRAATALHRWLEGYAVPRRLRGRATTLGETPARFSPIFRDREELPSSSELGGVLREALAASRYLIVVCSPNAARSRWVDEEIAYFQSLGRADRILALIIDGEPHAAEARLECFPPSLRLARGDDAPVRLDPIAADARKAGDGEQRGRMKLVAGLLGVGLDELLRRDRQRQLRKAAAWCAGVVASVTLFGMLLMQQRHEFHARAAEAYLAELVENGRRELVAGSQMRAAVYLSEAYQRGMDSPALRFMLRQAMQPLDALSDVIDIGAPLRAVALSQDDRTLAVLTNQGEVRVWSLAERREVARFAAINLKAALSYCGPAVSDDGRRLAMAEIRRELPNGVLRVWSLPDAALLLEAPIDSHNCGMSAPFNADGSKIVAIDPTHRPRLWSLVDGHSETLAGAETGVTTVTTFSPDGHWLAAGRDDGQVRLWKDGAVSPVARTSGLQKPIVTVDFDRFGELFVASADNGSIRGWTLPEGLVAFAGGHSSRLFQLQLADQARRMLTAATDGERVWSTGNGSLVYAGSYNSRLYTNLRADGEQVSKVEWRQTLVSDVVSSRPLFKFETDTKAALFTHDGQRLLSADFNGHVAIWNERFRPRNSARHDRGGSSGPMWSTETVDFALVSGGRILSGGPDGRLSLWSQQSLAPVGVLASLSGPITGVETTPDGSRAAASTSSGEIGVWEMSGHALLRRIDLSGEFISALALSPDGRHLFAVTHSKAGRLWDVATGKLLAEYPMDSRGAVDFSPDSRHLAIGSGQRLQVIDLATLAVGVSEPLGAANPPVGCVAFAPASDAVVAMANNESGIVRWISLGGATAKQIVIQGAHSCSGAQFDHEGQRVLLLPGAPAASIWNLGSHRVVRLDEHDGSINSARWSPDGRLVVTAGSDGLAKVSDAESGRLLQNLGVHGGQVHAVSFAPDGSTLFSSGDDLRLQSWEAGLEARSPEEILARVECISPWKLEGSQLKQQTIDLAECVGAGRP